MKLVHPLWPRSAVAAALVLLVACSGTPTEGNDPSTGEPAVSNSGTNDGDGAPRPGDVAAGEGGSAADASQGQDPQGPGEQRRQHLIKTSLQQARRALELNLWDDAARIAGEVLALAPSNEEARQILLRADEQLGRPGVQGRFEDEVRRAQVAQAKDRFETNRAVAQGDALMQSGKYGDAIEAYKRALLILSYSVYYSPGSQLENEIKAKLEAAEQAKSASEEQAEQSRLAQSRRELEEAERRLRIQQQTRVKRLVEEANYNFQIAKYRDAVSLLNEALKHDPNNQNAQALLQLASRARHENALEVIRAQWRAEWGKTFDDLGKMDVPQTDPIEYDIERWREVSTRVPLQFTPPDDLESPEEKAIMAKLESTVIEHRFAEADVTNWAAHYGSVTDVNFVVSAPVLEELDADATTLRDFRLPPMSVAKALDVIGDVTGVRWRVRNGVVELVTPANAGGKMYLVQYGVHDLVQGVPDRPGTDLKLKAPGDEEDFFDEGDEEPRPTVVDASKLEELLREHIEPEAWDREGASISEQRGVLLIRQSRNIHEQVEKLLGDLRQAVGIQVDVEARFLKVEDNFLEDIGVDFRGLGNQASEGLPGRGLERNNRQNTGFDDFGRREIINPATPGEIGTGTEPGFFFDDGQDGDIMGRTEHLYDQTLGNDALEGSGGLSLQYAFLDDAELEVVLRAVEKQERSEIVTAPRLLVFNNTRANMSVLRHTSFIRDFDVEIAQAASVANPVIDVVRDGVVLDVRPVVSADRRFITMELRPTVLTLELPIPTLTTTLGVGQPVSIQLPSVTLQRVRTTVTMPDGGSLMLGGMKFSEKQRLESGVPLLKDLPGLSFLFSRKGTFIQNRKILILIKAKIIMHSEFEPDLGVDPLDANLLSGR